MAAPTRSLRGAGVLPASFSEAVEQSVADGAHEKAHSSNKLEGQSGFR
jgi:hypothetical protein